MTKKITCRVIDSTPLSPDNPDLHLGWGLDSSIYPEQTLASDDTNHAAWKNQNHTSDTDAPDSLDCYA